LDWRLHVFKVETVRISNEPFDLEVDKKEELFPSHPAWEAHHQGNVDQLHAVGGLVEDSLVGFQMKLFAVFVTFQRKPGDGVVKTVVGDFPALVFIEFVYYFDKGSLGVRQIVHLYYSSKDPAFFLVLAVDEHILLDLVVVDSLSVTEVTADEGVEVRGYLESIKFVILSNFKVKKGGTLLSKVVVFDNVMTMNFSQDVLLLIRAQFGFYR
jgi:hypothetical protein